MLDLKKLVEGSVESVPFSVTLDASDISDDIIGGELKAEGEVINHSGFITLKGKVTPLLKTFCARCGKEFVYTRPFGLNAKITDKLANADEDEFIVIEDWSLDIEDYVRTEAILELPFRFLCKEDCKGLCPKCGIDLNIATCSCDKNDHDPRWDALKDYFD